MRAVVLFIALTLANCASAAVAVPTAKISLAELARQAMAVHFHQSKYNSLRELIDSTPVCSDYQESRGVFVTFSRDGKTRACWGSTEPNGSNLVESTILGAEKALTKEYRFARVRKSEWRSLKPQVTVVRSVEAIDSIASLNPLKYGLLVRSGGKAAVLLPEEARDAHYQLVACKLKAGIPVNQECQLYRISADVLK